jgi:hypothetical protein
MGRRGIPADSSVLSLSLVRKKKKGKGSERGFGRGFIGWRSAVKRERVGARPATDRRRRRCATLGTLGRVATSAPAARRGGAGESQQGRRRRWAG